MPDEPHIEQLLEAYRQKRRAAAGEPLVLHPATRHLLHAEVTRTHGTPAPVPAAAPVSWLAAFWPRLVLGGSAFALVAFVLFQVQMGPRPSVSETASDTPAADERGLVRSAAPRDKQDFLGGTPAPDAAPSLPQVKLEEDAARARGAAAAVPAKSQSAPATPVNEPLALARLEAAAGKPAPVTATPAGGGGATLALELGAFRDAALKNREQDMKSEASPPAKKLALAKSPAPSSTALAFNPPMPATAPPPPPAPAGPSGMSREIRPAGQAGTPLAWSLAKQEAAIAGTSPANLSRASGKAAADFYFTSAGVEAAQAYQYVNPRPDLRRNFNSPATPEVLAYFQVAVNGDQVRFTDADGSTYEGRLLPAGGDESAEQAGASPAVDEKSRGAKALADARDLKEELAKKATDDLSRAGARQDADKRSIADPLASVASRGSLGFVVSGTNRRLNRNVEFRGQFLPTPPEDTGQAQAGAGSFGRTVAAKEAQGFFEAKTLQPITAVANERRKQSLSEGVALSASQQDFRLPAVTPPKALADQPSPSAPLPQSVNQALRAGATSVPTAPGLTVSGWVVVGGSNQFEIRAVPAPRP